MFDATLVRDGKKEEMNLSDVYNEVNKCEKCGLCKNRITNYLFRGRPESRIIVIGEAPGRDEQSMGKPFIGRSGRLFDTLVKSIGKITNEDMYITNIVKDRPIGPDGKDRKPFYDEIKACESYILEEINIIKPKLIITLGKTSGDWFNEYEPYEINHYYKEKKWLPLYHPSYLLRNRKEITNFMKALKNTLEEIT